MNVNLDSQRGRVKYDFWGIRNCVQRVLRCDMGAIFDLMYFWWEERKEDKMEKCIEGLVAMNYPRAYTIAAVHYDRIANDYSAEFKWDESSTYYKKACEMFRLAYENGEKDIDYYYALYEMANGDRMLAHNVLNEIANDKRNPNCHNARRSLKREKKRNGLLGKFSVYAYDFDEKRLMHIFYLFIMWLMIFKIEGATGLGLFFLVIYIISKNRSGKVSKPKMKFDFLQEENLMRDPLYRAEKFEVSSSVSSWSFTELIEDIEDETKRIRADKKRVMLKRAQNGDALAENALKCFFGIYRQEDDFVEGGEATFGITEDYLKRKYRAIGLQDY